MNSKFAHIFLTLAILKQSDAFKIVSTSHHEKDFQTGDSVTLTCRSDGYWEYCNWRHRDRECQLEWKYSYGDVTKQQCHDDLEDRVSIAGDYNKHECSIRISGLEMKDAGSWECQMEAYVSGVFRGTTDKKSVPLRIIEPTTTESEPSSTTTVSSTTTQSTTTTTEETEHLATEDSINDIYSTEYDEEESQDAEQEEEDTKDDEIEALPVSDRDAEVGSVGLIVGVIVTMLALVIVMVMAGITWHRRRKSHQAIISYLQTERDDAMAANSFLEEAEYHISIIRDPQSLPLQQQHTLKAASDTLDDTVTVTDSKET